MRASSRQRERIVVARAARDSVVVGVLGMQSSFYGATRTTGVESEAVWAFGSHPSGSACVEMWQPDIVRQCGW
jgi:hypothetical protein